MSSQISAIKLAIEIAGGQNKLAEAIQVKHQSQISSWVREKDSRPVPPKHAIAIETFTKGRVTKHQLRPDIFGAPVEPVH